MDKQTNLRLVNDRFSDTDENFIQNEKNIYADELHEFIKNIFRRGGVESMANSMPFIIGAFVVTVDGKIVAANDDFLKLVDYDKSEIYGQEAISIVCPGDQKMVASRIKENNPNRYRLRLLNKHSKILYTTVSPIILTIDGVVYRLAEFVDNTSIVELKNEQIAALRNTAKALGSTIEKRDPYTVGHMCRTGLIAVEIARMLSVGQKFIERIMIGTSIHDIGKISVPIEILTKPDKLEPHEWEFIKRHPKVGYDILADIDFNETIKEIVLLHHESQDGSGYPYGLKAKEIPLEVSIVSVADALEAIAGVRPYRKAHSFEKAIDIMKKESNRFHGEALAAAGELVKNGKLNGKEYGIV